MLILSPQNAVINNMAIN